MSTGGKEKVRFFRSFLRSPKRVGSVMPSSSHLAAAMVRPIDFSDAETVVELGAGTGVFTQEIAQRLAPGARGIVFERDVELRSHLEARHPNLDFHPDALDMPRIVSSLDGSGVDAVVCSLPFANFSRETRARLAHDIHDVLKPTGKLIACQYSTQMRRMLKALFHDVSISFVALNVPPAFVYICTKSAQ